MNEIIDMDNRDIKWYHFEKKLVEMCSFVQHFQELDPVRSEEIIDRTIRKIPNLCEKA